MLPRYHSFKRAKTRPLFALLSAGSRQKLDAPRRVRGCLVRLAPFRRLSVPERSPLLRINAYINTLSLNQSAEIVKAGEIRANDA